MQAFHCHVTDITRWDTHAPSHCSSVISVDVGRLSEVRRFLLGTRKQCKYTAESEQKVIHKRSEANCVFPVTLSDLYRTFTWSFLVTFQCFGTGEVYKCCASQIWLTYRQSVSQEHLARMTWPSIYWDNNSVHPSVCLSVRPSHADIVLKRKKHNRNSFTAR